MGLKERIQADMQKAAKERNSLALSALRMALAAIKNKEIEARGEIGEDAVLKVLATMVKQRKESIELFERGGRSDLVGKETAAIDVLEAYLPKPLTDAEGESLVREAIAAAGAQSRPCLGGGGGAVPVGFGPPHERPEAEGGGPRPRQDLRRDGPPPAFRVDLVDGLA